MQRASDQVLEIRHVGRSYFSSLRSMSWTISAIGRSAASVILKARQQHLERAELALVRELAVDIRNAARQLVAVLARRHEP